MGIYNVTAPKPVCDVEPGEILEHDFTAAEEADLLAAGRLEIVPRKYRVVGSSNVADTKPGETFTHAFTVGQEQALLAGGHVERVDTAKPKAKASPPAADATNDKKKED
jgi:hypothetical protein